jgi:alcohol dehydrogenase class IV
MITTFNPVNPVIVGAGAAEKIGEEMAKFGCKRVMIVCDKGVLDAGIIEPITKYLKAADIDSIIFDKVQADPPDFSVDEGGKMAREEKADGLLAIGGGSSIDTTKGINILIDNPPTINNWFGKMEAPGNGVPFACIPTTAGTGSEMTTGGIITDTKGSGHKTIIRSPRHTKSKFCILDPKLQTSMPYIPSVGCALDILAHCVDHVVNRKAEPISNALAKQGIATVAEELPKLEENPTDLDIRCKLAVAANMAGISLVNTRTHLTHSIGHTLGNLYHIPHGFGCAIAMPQLFAKYAQWMPKETKVVAKLLGLNLPDNNITSCELSKVMHDECLAFLKRVKMPTYSYFKLTLEKLLDATELMSKDYTNAHSPEPMDSKAFGELMTASYEEYK